MPDIILAPALIDTTAQESLFQTFGEAVEVGPFLIGGAIYEVLQSQTPTAAILIQVFKTVIVGTVATSTNMDAAHAPVLDFTTGGCRYKPHVFGGKIHIAYQSNTKSQTVSFTVFNPVTGLFEASPFPAILDSGFPHPPATTPQGNVSDFGVRSDGSAIWVGFKWNAAITTFQMGFQTCPAAGAWSAFTVLESEGAGFPPTQPTFSIPSVGIDAADTAHVAYLNSSTGLNGGMKYLNITIGGAVSAPAQIIPLIGNNQPRPGVIKFLGANIFIPVTVTVGGGTGSKITAMVGTPLAAPVWTQTDLETTGAGVFLASQQATAILIDGLTATVVWIHNPDATSIQLNRSVFLNPAWDVAAVFYDLIANPPNAQPPANEFIASLSVGKIGSQGAVIVTSDASGLGAVGYLLFQGAAAPPAPPVPSVTVIIFPFPMMIECCCPGKMVSCVEPSKDGKLYAPTKTALKISD
jgi:hypothetical protein